MDDIDILLKQIRANGDEVTIAGPQPEKAVAELEKTLHIRMPPSYRAFLIRFGAMGIAGSAISGIQEGKPLAKETGWVYGDTLRLRADSELPKHLLVVQTDEDAPYCLDTSAAEDDDEFPMICYELDTQYITRLGDNFGAWFLEWLQLQAEE
jgi:hypothetical protein